MSSFINLLDVVYPIGCVYTSTNSTSPATLFGGTWDKIEDMFLYSSTGSETTGGSAEHEHHWFLSWLEYYGTMPSMDNNNAWHNFDSTSGGYDHGGTDYVVEVQRVGSSRWSHQYTANSTSYVTAHQPTVALMEAKTTTTSSLPPYLNCYMWKRTA